jgi:hypothetical protein
LLWRIAMIPATFSNRPALQWDLLIGGSCWYQAGSVQASTTMGLAYRWIVLIPSRVITGQHYNGTCL